MTSPEIVTKVQTLISSNPIFIGSTTWCPDCTVIKELFSKITPAENVKTVEMDIVSDGTAISDYLKEFTESRFVPKVFIGGKFIGTDTHILALQKEGKLDGLIADAVKKSSEASL